MMAKTDAGAADRLSSEKPLQVMIGFADALAAPEVVFSLRDAGFQLVAFTRAGTRQPAIAKLPTVMSLIELPPPEVNAEATIDALRAIAAEIEPAAVLPLDDAAIWLVDRAFGEADPSEALAMAGAIGAGAELALSKKLQIKYAHEAGFAVPSTRVATNRAEILAHDSFPAIVKPALAAELKGDGGLSRGDACYLMSADDLATLPPDDRLSYPALIQPLIAGDGEGVFGFAGKDGIAAWSGHQRVRMMNPHGSGSSACRSRAVEPDLKAAATRMMTAIGWRGPFMIELLRDSKGTAYFMELNGRLWGSTALARRAGLEYPAWAVCQALEPDFMPPSVKLRDPGVIRNLGRDLLHLLFLLRGPKSAFHRAHWPRFWPALGAVLKPAPGRNFYNWDPQHRWFHVRDAVATIRKFMSRKR